MTTDYVSEYKRQWDALEAADQAARTAKNMVGRYITHPYADGEAIYKITAVNGAKVAIEHVDIGDGWVLPAWGKRTTVSRAKAQDILDRRDSLQRLFQATEDWWEAQQIGATVHYDNGFGNYVRGVIVKGEKGKVMRATALIGNWNQRDICYRRQDGSIQYGTYAKAVKNGETLHPNAANMVEYPDHEIRRGADPRGKEPLVIDPPSQSAAELSLAEVTRFYARIIEALSYEQRKTPEATEAAIKEALARAAELLKKG